MADKKKVEAIKKKRLGGGKSKLNSPDLKSLLGDAAGLPIKSITGTKWSGIGVGKKGYPSKANITVSVTLDWSEEADAKLVKGGKK